MGYGWKSAEKGFRIKPLIEYMRQVPDPRCGRKTKHDHAERLICLVMGFLAGRTTIRRILKWCRKHLKWLQEILPLENGIASVPTACRILSGIDEELFALIFMEWIGSIVSTKGIHLAIDGKALRAAMNKVRDHRAPMVLNAIDAVTGLVLAQVPMEKKDCEITAIPELLKLLDITGSVVTIDAIGTQTEIMKKIIGKGGSFVLTVKKNQPEAYGEIMDYFDGIGTKARKDGAALESYEKIKSHEKNRDRHEHRIYEASWDCTCISKFKEEWGFLKTVGRSRQVRIPLERDDKGIDISPDEATFLKKGSRRRPLPVTGEGAEHDVQMVGLISDRKMGAEELGKYKREHWAIENSLHHVLDDSFREDRSPAKKSKNNLALIRKFAYNILRIAMIHEDCSPIMTEAMDDFCDDLSLIKRYVFGGIDSFY